MSTEPDPNPPARSSGPQGLLMGGVVLVLLALAAIVWLIVSGTGASPANNSAEAATNGAASASAMPNRGRLLPSGLRIETITEGSGPLVGRTDTPLVRYELRVAGSEQVIESNFEQPQPIPMPLGGVIPGFAEALTQIRVGGEARFWVPPSLGYGPATPPSAPFGPDDVLEFRVRVEGLAAGGGTPAAGNSVNDAAPAAETQNRS